MAKYQNDLGLDAALDWFNDADLMTLCTAQPTTFAEATTNSTLGLCDPGRAQRRIPPPQDPPLGVLRRLAVPGQP